MQLSASPLVSIVTPVYNGARYLEDLIQSVLKQDYPHIEHIVIDDGSNDDGATVAVLKRYPHLRWWSRDNRGQYPTINEGMAAARGDILGVICADDAYAVPSAISSVVDYWRTHPECAAVYGRVLAMDANGVPWQFQPHDVAAPFPLWFLRYHTTIAHCSLFVSRDIVVQRQVWFDPETRYNGDRDWILRLYLTGLPFGFVDRALSMYRRHDGQTIHLASVKALADERKRLMRRSGASSFVGGLVHLYIAGYKTCHALRVGGLRGLRNLLRDWRHLRRATGCEGERGR